MARAIGLYGRSAEVPAGIACWSYDQRATPNVFPTGAGKGSGYGGSSRGRAMCVDGLCPLRVGSGVLPNVATPEATQAWPRQRCCGSSGGRHSSGSRHSSGGQPSSASRSSSGRRPSSGSRGTSGPSRSAGSWRSAGAGHGQAAGHFTWSASRAARDGLAGTIAGARARPGGAARRSCFEVETGVGASSPGVSTTEPHTASASTFPRPHQSRQPA